MRYVITGVMTALLYPLSIWLIVGRAAVLMVGRELPNHMLVGCVLLGVTAVAVQLLMKKYGLRIVPSLYYVWFNAMNALITAFLLVIEGNIYTQYAEMRMIRGDIVLAIIFFPGLLASFTAYIILNFFYGALNHHQSRDTNNM